MSAPIVWAQRKDVVLVTINVHDSIGSAVQIDSNSFTYTGQSSNKETNYNQKLEIFAEIDPSQSRYVVRPRGIEISLKKKGETVWWPRLAKTTVKLHYVSVDWGKWVDSSDDEDENKQGFDWDPADMEGDGCGSSCSSDNDDDGLDDVKPEGEADAAPAEGETKPTE